MPSAGSAKRGRRAAASRASRSSLKRWPFARSSENWPRSTGAAMLRICGAADVEGAVTGAPVDVAVGTESTCAAGWSATMPAAVELSTIPADVAAAGAWPAASAYSEVSVRSAGCALSIAAWPAATTAPAATATTATRPLRADGGAGMRWAPLRLTAISSAIAAEVTDGAAPAGGVTRKDVAGTERRRRVGASPRGPGCTRARTPRSRWTRAHGPRGTMLHRSRGLRGGRCRSDDRPPA